MKPKVVITHWVHPEVIRLLENSCEVIANPTRETLPRQEIIHRASTAQAVITFMPDKIDAEFLAACPNLKIIACALKGYDNFDVAACTERGIWVTIVPDLLSEPTAELALALLLGLTRCLREGDQLIRSGSYSGWKPQLYSTFGRLQEHTVGIIGMGAVGKILAQRLKGFETRLIYLDQIGLPLAEEQRLNVSRVSNLEELLKQGDIIVPLLPLTPQTFQMFNANTIAKMKPNSLLINVGRGSLVDEEAVAEALEAKQLWGYAADVFEMEDWARADRPRTINQKLLDNPAHTLFTPHLGSAIDDVRREIALRAAQSILQVLANVEPQGAINRPI